MTFTENVALCVGLTLSRVMDYRLVKFTLSEAQFIIINPTGSRKSRMLFYNEDAPKVEKLSLGRIYRFSARTVTYNNDILMYYDPGCTNFIELSQNEAMEVDVCQKSDFCEVLV